MLGDIRTPDYSINALLATRGVYAHGWVPASAEDRKTWDVMTMINMTRKEYSNLTFKHDGRVGVILNSQKFIYPLDFPNSCLVRPSTDGGQAVIAEVAYAAAVETSGKEKKKTWQCSLCEGENTESISICHACELPVKILPVLVYFSLYCYHKLMV